MGQRQGAWLARRHRGRQRRRRPVQCRPAWPVLGPRRTPGPQTRYVHRRPTRRASPHPRPHLAALPQSQGLRRHPSPARKASLSARFDRIFGCKTGFATLDRLLARLRANKSELLRVLERPEIPLNTNGSENDIRCQVTKRKISGGTRSDAARDCRDAFLGLNKTCAKLGIAFSHYLAPASPSRAARISPPCRNRRDAPRGLADRRDFGPDGRVRRRNMSAVAPRGSLPDSGRAGRVPIANSARFFEDARAISMR